MTVLVTGATGNIGRHVVDCLVRRGGAPVRALTRNPTSKRLPERVEAVSGDLTAPDTLGRAMAGVTAMHLISIGGDDYAPLHTAEEVVARAVDAGVRRVTVLTGTEDELAVLEAVAASGLAWTHVRPVELMSNKLGWAESIRSEGVVRAPFAEQPHAIVDEADVGAVVAAALVEDGHSGRTYTPTGPQALTPVQAARVIGDAIGRDIRFVELSPEQVREQMRASGLRDQVIDDVIAYGADPPQVAYTVLPTVRQVTGRPAHSFQQWVAEHADAFRSASATAEGPR